MTASILRRKHIASEYLKASTRTIQSLETVGMPLHFQWQNSRSLVSCRREDLRRVDEDIQFFSSGTHAGFTNDKHKRILFDTGIEQQEIFFTMTSRCGSTNLCGVLLQQLAGQPHFGSDDDEENEKMAVKKRKEPSHGAAVGLTSAKAKAKGKKLHISQKVERSIPQRTLALVMGIGPALRAVAAMSREDWAKKLTSSLEGRVGINVATLFVRIQAIMG